MTVTMPSPATTDAQAWSSDANEALRLSLDRASLTAREVYEGFHPTFTYPIFGEEERLYGYRGLTADLKFASGSLAQYVHVSYEAKLPSSSAVDDVEGTLANFIPSGYYTDEAEFLKRVEDDALTFTPPGTRVFSYTRPAAAARSGKGKEKGKNVAISQLLTPEDEETIDFEVYNCTWDTPGFRDYHRRVQLFILLYIEAGSFISEDEDGWEFMLLFERRRRRATPDVATYHFVGYSTLYPFYCFPERVRMRLSQFVILPPYQQEGHGSALYTAIYQYVLATPSIAELTVEDPAEAFEDLRDRNDLKMLLADEQFMREALGEGGFLSSVNGRARKSRSVRGVGGEDREVEKVNGVVNGNGVERRRGVKRGKLGPPADKQWVEQWRIKLKIASRQFNRLIEMLMLKHMDENDARATRGYRLQVKERLYRFNYDALVQLDKKERLQKLDETFRNVREDYRRILALLPH